MHKIVHFSMQPCAPSLHALQVAWLGLTERAQGCMGQDTIIIIIILFHTHMKSIIEQITIILDHLGHLLSDNGV